MHCISCGTSLPIGAAHCPTCGVGTPYNTSSSGASPYDYTVASSPSGVPPPKPATDYGSPPYGVPPQNPYDLPNPYHIPPPPPLPPSRRRVKIGLMSGVVVLVLIVASVSVFALLSQRARNTPPGNTFTTTQTSATIASTNTPQSIYTQATSGNPVLSDPLNAQTSSNWSEDSAASSSCAFTGGTYQIQEAQNNFVAFCFAQATNFSNFAFQVQMTISQGDGGGLIFRDNNAEAYRFFVSSTGTYDLVVTPPRNGTGVTRFVSGTNAAISTGLNQTNMLTVIARNSMIYLYVNKQYVASTSDSTSSSGEIGLFAYDSTGSTDVIFSNAQVWSS